MLLIEVHGQRATIHRPSESINSRKPIFNPTNLYSIGPGLWGAWHPDKRSSRGISLHAWMDIRSNPKNLRLSERGNAGSWIRVSEKTSSRQFDDPVAFARAMSTGLIGV
jgi:hypothetical protein